MVAVRDQLHRFDPQVKIAVVTFADQPLVADYQQRNEVPFPVLVDSNRSAYRTYGIGRGTLARVYGWRVVRRYYQIYRTTGFGDYSAATEDTLQLGADFVIAADGTLTYARWSAGPDDRPAIEELIAATRVL